MYASYHYKTLRKKQKYPPHPQHLHVTALNQSNSVRGVKKPTTTRLRLHSRCVCSGIMISVQSALQTDI